MIRASQCDSYDTYNSGEYSHNSINNSITNFSGEFSNSVKSPKRTHRSRPGSGVEDSEGSDLKHKRNFVLPSNVIPYKPEILLLSEEEHTALISLTSEDIDEIDAKLRQSI